MDEGKELAKDFRLEALGQVLHLQARIEVLVKQGFMCPHSLSYSDEI